MSSLIDVLLEDPDEASRAVAASTLGELTLSRSFVLEREAVLGALRSALADPSREVQSAAGRALDRLRRRDVA